MKIYLAGPLFNMPEKRLNESICQLLEEAGHEVFLPQRDAGELARGTFNPPEEVFNKDVAAIDACDCVVAVLEGRTQDEGTCWEMGYAYAKGKHIIAYSTDKRTFMRENQFNNMLTSSYNRHYSSVTSILSYLNREIKI
jgi:nucleoside 2-deoxyribosyltransferase